MMLRPRRLRRRQIAGREGCQKVRDIARLRSPRRQQQVRKQIASRWLVQRATETEPSAGPLCYLSSIFMTLRRQIDLPNWLALRLLRLASTFTAHYGSGLRMRNETCQSADQLLETPRSCTGFWHEGWGSCRIPRMGHAAAPPPHGHSERGQLAERATLTPDQATSGSDPVVTKHPLVLSFPSEGGSPSPQATRSAKVSCSQFRYQWHFAAVSRKRASGTTRDAVNG